MPPAGPSDVISLAGRSRVESSPSRLGWRPTVVATAITAAGFVAVFVALAPLGLRSFAAPTSGERQGEERLEYIALPPSEPVVVTPSVSRAQRRRPQVAPASPMTSAESEDIASGDTASAPATVAARNDAPASASTRPSLSRLVPPRSARGAASWVATARDPFATSAPASPAQQDSLLAELRHALPAMARARVQTASERDAAIKERMLLMRLAGRPLLAPPQGGGGGGAFDLPLFSPGRSRSERVRDSIAFEEDRPRRERLRQRVDSVRRGERPIP